MSTVADQQQEPTGSSRSSARSTAAAADRLRFHTEHLRGCVIVRLGGEIDFTTAEIMREHVTAEAMAHTAPCVVLDMAGVEFCDSSGLGALIVIDKAIRARQGRFVLAQLPEMLRRILNRTGLDGHIESSVSVQGAVARHADRPAPGQGPRRKQHS